MTAVLNPFFCARSHCHLPLPRNGVPTISARASPSEVPLGPLISDQHSRGFPVPCGMAERRRLQSRDRTRALRGDPCAPPGVRVSHRQLPVTPRHNQYGTPRSSALARFSNLHSRHHALCSCFDHSYWRRDIVALGGYEANPAWPVDMDFWMRWVGAGRRTLKLQEPLYMWRQHEGQGTRNSGRCSIDNLRRCKVCKRFFSYPLYCPWCDCQLSHVDHRVPSSLLGLVLS